MSETSRNGAGTAYGLWRPAREAPERTGVLVYSPDAEAPQIWMAFREGDDWWDVWGERDTPSDAEVTHWMPLPELPE